MKRLAEIFKTDHNGSIYELEEVLKGTIKITAPPGRVLETDPEPQASARGDTSSDALEWVNQARNNKINTIKPCIVIDNAGRWHFKAKVDLKGADTSLYTWRYYGTDYPVLVQEETGTLKPFFLPEVVGENSSDLYTASNPEGFKASFSPEDNLLKKLQIGLMITLVIVLFFFMFLFINWEGG